jgi:streptogramin lyase
MHRLLLISIAVVLLGATAVVAQDKVAPGFTDCGVAAAVAEGGGIVATRDGNGHNLVIANSQDLSPRGWILVTDVDTGETWQIYHPEEISHAWPYGSLMAGSGMFYTANGGDFLEFDPTKREFTFCNKPSPQGSAYMWMIEDPEGTIWAGSVYNAGLISYDPKTKTTKDHGALDPVEKYIRSLGHDDEGWIYAGIGTSRCNIAAYNTATGEKLQMVPEDKRTLSTASVYRGVDGKVYGTAVLTDATHYYRMSGGKAEDIAAGDMATRAPSGSIYYGQITATLPDGRRIQHNMLERYLDVTDPKTNEIKRIEFDYKTEGLLITSLGAGPDGLVYISTCHPMHLISLDTKTAKLKDMGPIPIVGGGNFCAITSQGDAVIGVEYSGGRIWKYDPAKAWNPAGKRKVAGLTAEKLMQVSECKDGHFTYLKSNDVAFLCGDKFGAEGTFRLTAPADGKYWLQFVPLLAGDYCRVQFLFDGKELGEPFNASGKVVMPDKLQTHGPLDLKAGVHRLSMRTIKTDGKQPWCAMVTADLSTERRDSLVLQPDSPNPMPLAQWAKDICRPRTALAYPDGKHVLMAGFPGYGLCGGGIGIVNLETGEDTLLTAEEDLVPGQNCITLKVLPDGNLIGGTSIHGSGGGHSTAQEAILYIVDWATKKVSFSMAPVPGDGNIISIQVAADGLVYGLSGNATFFVFDPKTREIVHSEKFAQYGGVPRHALQIGPDGKLYATLSKAIVRITPGTFEHEKLADTPVPISAGGAFINGMLVFASQSRVWTYEVPDI